MPSSYASSSLQQPAQYEGIMPPAYDSLNKQFESNLTPSQIQNRYINLYDDNNYLSQQQRLNTEMHNTDDILDFVDSPLEQNNFVTPIPHSSKLNKDASIHGANYHSVNLKNQKEILVEENQDVLDSGVPRHKKIDNLTQT